MTTPTNNCTRCNGKGCYECVPEVTPANEWREEFDRQFGRFSLGENNGRERGWKSIEILKPFIQNLLNTHSAHLVERLQKLKKPERTEPIDDVPPNEAEFAYGLEYGHNHALDQAIDIIKDNK